MNRLTLSITLLLAACGNGAAENRSTVPANALDGPMPAGAPPLPKPPAAECPVPGLDFTELKTDFAEAQKVAFATNWEAAVTRACKEKLSGDKPLNHPDELGPMLVLLLAPDANVVSIYPDDDKKRMLLEGPFGTPPQAPSADELHEAIYCAVKGATPEEQEKDGRCLPD